MTGKKDEEEQKTYTDDERFLSLILSTTEAVGKYSFADKRQPYSNESPPPKYFSNDLLLNFGLSNKKDEILKGLIIPP